MVRRGARCWWRGFNGAEQGAGGGGKADPSGKRRLRDDNFCWMRDLRTTAGAARANQRQIRPPETKKQAAATASRATQKQEAARFDETEPAATKASATAKALS